MTTTKTDTAGFGAAIATDGFGFVAGCLDSVVLESVRLEFPATNGLQRDLLSVPAIRALAQSPQVRNAVETVLGRGCFAVRGLFFNKTPDANWNVSWHQDLTISVGKRLEASGFTSWSMKANAVHVQPPAEILERMIAIRIPLDDNTSQNGPLRCVPGSHLRGRLSAEDIAQLDKSSAVTCCARAGDALLMRPLTVHASSQCQSLMPRRVIHLEFADVVLPHGLHWRNRV
ncbi:MAG: phytanoyl-CoA dioxygenase family protein [Candidatus Acidiferrales bacterium]